MWAWIKYIPKIWWLVKNIFGSTQQIKVEVSMDLYDAIKGFVEETKADVIAAKADGKITAQEAWGIVTEAVAELVKVAEVLNVSGEQKKVLVLAAADKLYEEVLRPIDIPWVPNVVIEPRLDDILKGFYMNAVSGIIDGLVKVLFKK